MLNVTTPVATSWRTMVRTGANMLVIGSSDLLAMFGSVCGGEFREPVACTSSATFDLRATVTLIVTDVHLLDTHRQRALAEWLANAANSRAQVLSLAPMPVFPLVQEGRFDASLYYRLNTICLRLDCVDPADLPVIDQD